MKIYLTKEDGTTTTYDCNDPIKAQEIIDDFIMSDDKDCLLLDKEVA